MAHYICRPLLANVPVGHPGWEETTCPECGEPCWKRPEDEKLKEIFPGLKAFCTECSLKKGLKGGVTSHV